MVNDVETVFAPKLCFARQRAFHFAAKDRSGTHCCQAALVSSPKSRVRYTIQTMSDGSGVVWKHIGLHGHSVGTFACEDNRVLWKSAISGRDDDVGSSTTKSIPADKLSGAQWTVFGSSGHLRLQTKPGSANLKYELRFDGFPSKDFDTLKNVLQKKYSIALKNHAMSSAGTQYGLTHLKGKNLVFRHCVLDEMNEEGQEFEPRAEEEMMSLDLAEVSQCVLPGNNRNEIEAQFPESDTVEAGTDQLGKSQ